MPNGVRLRDAAEILPSSAYFAYRSGVAIGSQAAYANLFRYKLLLHKGGWWVDTDVVCLTNEIPSFDVFLAYEDHGHIINNAVMYFQQGHLMMRRCIDEAMTIRERVRWGDMGPRLVKRLSKEFGLSAKAKPRSTCYPLHWSRATDVLDPAETACIESCTEESFFIHLWNEIFRRKGIDKARLPPAGSYLHRLAIRHPVAEWRYDDGVAFG